jgi:hypothetical protein
MTLAALAVSSFVVFTGIASALGAFAGKAPAEPATDQSTSPRKAIASGNSPGIGDWKIWYSQSARGGRCVEIQFVDPAEEAVPPEFRLENSPAPGEGSLAGGCGQVGALTASTLNLPEQTLVFGIARKDVERVVTRGAGGASADARLFKPPDADVNVYARAMSREAARGLRISARAKDGQEIAVQQPVLPQSLE